VLASSFCSCSCAQVRSWSPWVVEGAIVEDSHDRAWQSI
jgi:hypothetical protein